MKYSQGNQVRRWVNLPCAGIFPNAQSIYCSNVRSVRQCMHVVDRNSMTFVEISSLAKSFKWRNVTYATEINGEICWNETRETAFSSKLLSKQKMPVALSWRPWNHTLNRIEALRVIPWKSPPCSAAWKHKQSSLLVIQCQKADVSLKEAVISKSAKPHNIEECNLRSTS